MVCGNVPYHWGVTCSAGQVIQSISSNGTPVCVSKAVGGSCASGYYVSGISNDGNINCSIIPSNPTVLNFQCPYGQQMIGISNNSPICRNRIECRIVIGGWALQGSVAWCNPDEYAVGGGFESETGVNLGFAHVSVPGGNNWSTDSAKVNGDNLALCCK